MPASKRSESVDFVVERGDEVDLIAEQRDDVDPQNVADQRICLLTRISWETCMFVTVVGVL